MKKKKKEPHLGPWISIATGKARKGELVSVQICGVNKPIEEKEVNKEKPTTLTQMVEDLSPEVKATLKDEYPITLTHLEWGQVYSAIVNWSKRLDSQENRDGLIEIALKLQTAKNTRPRRPKS